MRYPGSIALKSVVIHGLDSRSGAEEPRYSRGLVPFQDDADLTTYLTTHIRQSLKHTASQAAKFTAIEDGKVSGTCKALFDGKASLLEGSKLLAADLYEIMKQDKRIKPGVLATCFYTDPDTSQDEEFLALLKIDLGKVFRTKMVQDRDGNEVLSLAVDNDALTTTRERLQKSVFVRALDPRSADYDMILLDRQSRSGVDEEGELVPRVATFFIEGFLEAEPALSEKERTEGFCKGVRLGRDTPAAAGQLTVSEDYALNQATEVALASPRINIEAWVTSLPLPADRLAVVRNAILQFQTEPEFTPDVTVVRRMTRKIRYAGSGGLRISFDADAFEDIWISEEDGQEGQRRFKILTLHSDFLTKIQ